MLITSNTPLGTLQNGGRLNSGEKNIRVCYFCFPGTNKKVFLKRLKTEVEPLKSHGLFYRCIYYVFEPRNVSVMLLSECQIALRFHQKHLNLWSEDERRSYGFGTTWGWVINDRIFILRWTNPLSPIHYWTLRSSTDFILLYLMYSHIVRFMCNLILAATLEYRPLYN